LWSVLAHIHPVVKHAERISNYKKYEDEINMTGISYPVSMKDIDKFEKLNDTISINLFGINENNDIFPLRIATSKKQHHIRLMYISNECNQHYVLITNLSSMVGTQINAHHSTKYFCDRCLNPFQSEDVLKKHLEICEESNPVREFYPKNEVKKIYKN